MTDEAATLLNYMPIIVRDGEGTAWERKFCASMIKQSRTGRFQPSPGQMVPLRRIVRAFQNRNMRAEVIE